MSSTDIAVQQPRAAITAEVRDLLRKTVCKDASPIEFEFFLAVCARTGLDPVTKQIYAIMRTQQGQKVMTIQTAIDGLRLTAERTNKYEGQTPPEWCGADGVWRDVWLSNDPPLAARVGIHRTGFREPLYKPVTWRSYCQYDRDGKPTGMWAKMPPEQLCKCSEAAGLRASFPNDLDKIYIPEELDQMENEANAHQLAMQAELKKEENQRALARNRVLKAVKAGTVKLAQLESVLKHKITDPDLWSDCFGVCSLDEAKIMSAMVPKPAPPVVEPVKSEDDAPIDTSFADEAPKEEPIETKPEPAETKTEVKQEATAPAQTTVDEAPALELEPEPAQKSNPGMSPMEKKRRTAIGSIWGKMIASGAIDKQPEAQLQAMWEITGRRLETLDGWWNALTLEEIGHIEAQK